MQGPTRVFLGGTRRRGRRSGLRSLRRLETAQVGQSRGQSWRQLGSPRGLSDGSSSGLVFDRFVQRDGRQSLQGSADVEQGRVRVAVRSELRVGVPCRRLARPQRHTRPGEVSRGVSPLGHPFTRPHNPRGRIHHCGRIERRAGSRTLRLRRTTAPKRPPAHSTAECGAGLLKFRALDGRLMTAAFDGGPISSDGGLLLLREVGNRGMNPTWTSPTAVATAR